MPSSVPTPFAAALGLVPTVLGGVRALPGKAVQLPVFAVSSVLTGLDTARRGYDDLAERGERLISQLRGTSFDELEDRAEDALQGSALARPYDAVEDALEAVGETVAAFAGDPKGAARAATRSARTGAGQRLEAAAEVVEALAAKAEGAASPTRESDPEQAPKHGPTPKAAQPDTSRVATAASTDVVATVERVAAAIGGEVLDHDDLPLPDYDHLTLGALRGRMRSLNLAQLVALRDYEQAKANRLPVVTMLDNRIAKLASDPSAPLSDGGAGPTTTSPAAAVPPKASPATAAAAPTTPSVAHGGLGGSTG